VKSEFTIGPIDFFGHIFFILEKCLDFCFLKKNCQFKNVKVFIFFAKNCHFKNVKVFICFAKNHKDKNLKKKHQSHLMKIP